LAIQLYEEGVAGFLPTTLSGSVAQIESALSSLGAWIDGKHQAGPRAGEAFPLGIHLEGPFIAKACCGAHPAENLIPPSLELLKRWHQISHRTLAKITIAPETAEWTEIRKILVWAKKHKISVSLGHSQTNSALALRAIRFGANSLTHAWNAMPFHHRNPGLLGVALGTPNLFVEIIPDNTHVSDLVVDWTLRLHEKGVCFVSDAVPAAHTRQWSSFGPLKVQISQGAGRTRNGALAGGGSSLFETFQGFWKRHLNSPFKWSRQGVECLLQALTEWPLQSIPSSSRWLARLRQTHVFEYRLGKHAGIRPLPRVSSKPRKQIKS
ncbi:hypothetical protein EBZ37_08575, partial [bacterium]|nr:hypothetical protein [bacterium]